MLEKKDYVSVSKRVHKQKLQLAKVFVICRNFILLSKKTPKFKYWVLKVLCLETQMVRSGWLKNDSLCLRMKRSSKFCAIVNAMDGDLTYKDLVKLTLSCPKYFHLHLFATTFISPSFTRAFF